MKVTAFSIPIYRYKIADWQSKKQQLLDLFHSFEERQIVNVLTSPSDIKTNLFLDEIKSFERESGIKFHRNVTIWFQKYKRGMNHDVHNHGPWGFSACAMIKYSKEVHPSITFVSPFHDYINGELTRYQPDVEEGDIIFFPSNLSHYVPVNQSDETRIVAPFNLHIDRQYFPVRQTQDAELASNLKMSYD